MTGDNERDAVGKTSTDEPVQSASRHDEDTVLLLHRLASALVGRRRVLIVVVLALVLAASAGIVFLEEESGLPEFELGTEEEAKQSYIETNFSAGENDEITQIIVRGENVFEKETLVSTLEMQQQIRTNETVGPTLNEERPTAGLANIIATTAIQHEHPERTAPSLDEQIAVLEAMDQPTIDAVAAEILADESSEAYLFLPNDYEPGTTTASSTMVVTFQPVEEGHAPTAAPRHIVETHLAIEHIAGTVHADTAVVGSGILTDEEERALDDTMSLVGPVALLLVVLVLALAYRDLLDVVLGFAGILLVLFWTFGVLGWLGMAFNPVLIAVPVLLIGLSIDFCIHVFMRYREHRTPAMADGGDREKPGIGAAMAAGLAGVGAALVWVTVTTSVGFLSNLASPVAAIGELGLIAAIGIVGAFVVFVLLMPLLKVELDSLLERVGVDRVKPPLGTGGGYVTRLLGVGSQAARTAPLAVLLAVLLLTALTTVAAANVSTTWGPEENMVDGAPEWTQNLPGDLQPGEYTAKENLRFANEQYVRHGSTVDILVEGDVTAPDTVERVAAAEERATQQGVVVNLASGSARTTSPLSTMQRVAEEDDGFAETFRNADTTGDGVPDSNLSAVYDHLFEVAPEQAADVIHREDGEYRAVRMAVSVDPAADGKAITDQFQTVAGELERSETTVTATGEPIIGHLVSQHLLQSLLYSLAITLVLVIALLMVVFRVVHDSATLGLVTLLPVVFAVSWIIGTMYLLGYPLSVLNAIIASLTIGIGIDYSIHISERFRDELRSVGDVGRAIATTVRGTGGALLGSAMTTAIGFGVLALAIHPPLQQFGIVTAIMIGYAFVGAVFVLPSLLVLWAKLVPRQ